MGELMPPTADNPMGYYEAFGVVAAHRELLGQMERDWTCPPTRFRPELLDLSSLEEQVAIHTGLPGVWAMKDPRSMFLLPAWSHLGVERARLVAVVRNPADTIRSIERRDHIRQDRAEAIVDAYMRRLVEIAGAVPLPVIQFPGDDGDLIDQVRNLAASLDLPWDEEAARSFFDETLVRNRSRLRDTSPTHDQLIAAARFPDKVPATDLGSLDLGSEPEWPLETHLGVRHGQHRNQLWKMARFSTHREPEVVEVLLEGARPGGRKRRGVTLHQTEVRTPMEVGAAISGTGTRPHGVIAHGIVAGRPASEVEYLFRSVYLGTDPLAEFVIDVPDPEGNGLLGVIPTPVDQPQPDQVQEIAAGCGWEHIAKKRLSPGRSGLVFRKKILTDSELIPVVADVIANIGRIHSFDVRLSSVEAVLEHEGEPDLPVLEGGSDTFRRALEAEKQRADKAEKRAGDAEQAFARLSGRRSVRFALALSRPARGLFRRVRSWKKKP